MNCDAFRGGRWKFEDDHGNFAPCPLVFGLVALTPRFGERSSKVMSGPSGMSMICTI